MIKKDSKIVSDYQATSHYNNTIEKKSGELTHNSNITIDKIFLNNSGSINNILPEKFEDFEIKLTEKTNTSELYKHIYSGECDMFYSNRLLKYASSLITKDKIGSINITYKVPLIGRLKPEINNKSICSQTYQWQNTKYETCRDLYTDIDIVNCQPVLLEQLMKKEGLSTKCIRKYNENRNTILTKLMRKFKWNRKETKKLIFSLMFNSYENIKISLRRKRIHEKDLPRMLNEYLVELFENQKKLLEKYPEFLKLAESRKKEEETKKVKKYLEKLKINRSTLCNNNPKFVKFVKEIIEEKKGKNVSRLLYDYLDELWNNRDNLVTTEKYKNFVDFVINQDKIIKGKNKDMDKASKYWNINGCAFAYMAQTLEKWALLSMYEYFNKKGIHVGALIHDGMHVDKDADINLSECEEYVFKKTGFKITLTKKKFEREKYKNVIRFNELAGEKRLNNVEVSSFKSEFLTKMNDNDERGICGMEMIHENRISLFKSYTGSGKTYMIKKFCKKYKKLRKLSLVSRRSLSDIHEIELHLTNYQNAHKYAMDTVYQADSMDKIPEEINEDFILIIDEVASFCDHLLNKMEKMSKNRLLLASVFKKLINHPHCKFVIGVDFNIHYGTLEFLCDITDKKIELNVNTYNKKRETEINIYLNKYKHLKKAIEYIKNGKQLFICSNMCTQFMLEYVFPIIKECELNKNEYLVYCGNDGEKNIDSKLWKNKRVIFTTPTIVYGIDSKHKLNVFGVYYSANHFDAQDCNQQLNRERLPESMHIYIANQYIKSFESVEKAKEKGKLNMKIIYSIRDDDEIRSLIKPLENLLYYKDYRESHYLNLRHHIIDLLRRKGYYNFNYIYDKAEKEFTLKREQFINMKLNEYKKYEATDKRIDDVESKLEMFNLKINTDITNNELLEEYKKIIENHLDIFIDERKFKNLVYYSKFKNNNYFDLDEIKKKQNIFTYYDNYNDEFNKDDSNQFKIVDGDDKYIDLIKSENKRKCVKFSEKMAINKNNYDIVTSIITNVNTKLQYLDKLRRYLDINVEDLFNVLNLINKDNYNNKIKIPKKFLADLYTIFNVNKKEPLKNTRIELLQFYTSKLKSLLGCCMCSKKKNMLNDKKRIQFILHQFNNIQIDIFDNIFIFKKKYDLYLKN